jgi:long-chain fatty acid transport protein
MKKSLYTLLFAAGLANSVLAQGFQVNFQGQKQQGTGCAGSAKYVDGSSLFFNPGASAFAEESSANVAMTPVFANIMYVDAATNEAYRSNSPMGTPFSAYALLHFNKIPKLNFGLAVYTPFGSVVSYEDNWIGRFAITRLQLQAIFVQPTVSYKLNDKLGIGAGFVYSTGEVNLRRDLPVQFEDGSFGKVELGGSALGFGYNLGLSYQASEKLTLGLTYRSKVQMTLDGGIATFTMPEALAENFPNTTFAGSLPLPSVSTLGLAYKFSDKLDAVLDVNYVGWKAYDTLAFDYAQNTASLEDTKSPRDYKSIFAFRGGVNYHLNENLVLRGGMGFGFTPVQDGYVTPETPDNNRLYGTCGVGYKVGKHFEFDASFYYARLKRTDTNLETNLSGTFTTIGIAPGFAFIYKW